MTNKGEWALVTGASSGIGEPGIRAQKDAWHQS